MINQVKILKSNQVEDNLSPDLLWVILGPTASGKTKLAVELAKRTNAEIISVDSRQVYQGMDIGTGKDLNEYHNIPYHLIDITKPGDKYNIARFQKDFSEAFSTITKKKSQPIAVGGTGLYLHSLLIAQPYINIPISPHLRERLENKSTSELLAELSSYQKPKNFNIDCSTNKRIIRAIEILSYLKQTPTSKIQPARTYPALVFGINPKLEKRRIQISNRLRDRVEEGLIPEVENLIRKGTSHDDLQYYGLEYKYTSLYLLGNLDRQSLFERLETEIHRYAKRQMTFFRKMEKDGVKINWLNSERLDDRIEEMLFLIKQG